jgi:DNA replication and repair protein RecF
MVVLSVTLTHFRNHASTSISFGPGVNILLGNNGQGKTNILEALSFVSLTRSFFSAAERSVVQFGEENFLIDAVVRTDAGRTENVRVQYAAGTKELAVNGVSPEKMADMFGRFPAVVLSPEHDAVTAGGPAERRRWIDMLLSQVSPAYLQELIDYRRVLHQRNKVLLDARLDHRPVAGRIEPWSDALITHGVRLMLRRLEFLREFADQFAQAYRRCVVSDEQASITYRPSVAMELPVQESSLATAFRQGLQRRGEEEERRGTTLVGPHRDDLAMALNDVPLQEFGSQGQHKTFLVALKFAEYAHLREKRNESPQFLLDDLFSDLDEERSERICDELANMGQCVITTTSNHPLARWSRRHPVSTLYVEAGTCRPIG